MNAPDFYRELNQPGVWAPPGWLFGPVWTTLYTFMGIAAWLVWRVPHENRIRNLWVFVVHLAVNALWSWLFFAWYLGLVSFLWILLLAAFIIFLIREFWRVQKVAAWLLVPYLAWVFVCSRAELYDLATQPGCALTRYVEAAPRLLSKWTELSRWGKCVFSRYCSNLQFLPH